MSEQWFCKFLIRLLQFYFEDGSQQINIGSLMWRWTIFIKSRDVPGASYSSHANPSIETIVVYKAEAHISWTTLVNSMSHAIRLNEECALCQMHKMSLEVDFFIIISYFMSSFCISNEYSLSLMQINQSPLESNLMRSIKLYFVGYLAKRNNDLNKKLWISTRINCFQSKLSLNL